MKYKNKQLTTENINFQSLAKKFGTPAYCYSCLLYTSPSPRDRTRSRMPSSA